MSTYSISPGIRAWLRFKKNRRGYYSFYIFCILFVASLFAELISNDRPLIVNFKDSIYVPLIYDYPETVFGGDFSTSADYLDPFIKEKLDLDSNWIIYPLNQYSFNTLNYFSP